MVGDKKVIEIGSSVNNDNFLDFVVSKMQVTLCLS
jgi:hypothetical protein